MEKEVWINEALESINGIKSADAKNISWQIIQQRIDVEQQQQNKIFKQQVKWAAAAFVMVLMNISILMYINNQPTPPANNLAEENIAKEMGIINSYNY